MKETLLHLTSPEATTHTKIMPDGGQNLNPEAPRASKDISTRREVASAAWRKFFETRPDTPAGPRAVYKEMEELGIPPMAGGADDDPEHDAPPAAAGGGGGRGRGAGGEGRREGGETEHARRTNWRNIRDLELQRIAEVVARAGVDQNRVISPRGDLAPVDPEVVRKAISHAEELRDLGRVDLIEARDLLTDLRDIEANTANTPVDPGRTEYFYLKAEDLAVLETGIDGPRRWLDRNFDLIYQVAQEGQEMNSEIVRTIQSSVGDAARHLQYSRMETPEVLRYFGSEFSIRLNLIIARVQVERREIDQAIGAAQQLTSHGLLNSFSFDGGRVEAMYKTLQENYDDMRLREQIEGKFNIVPEMNAKLQGRVEIQQLDLARQHLGAFGDLYEKEQVTLRAALGPEAGDVVIRNKADERIKREIRRSVRTAYDAFVVSQRQAVIVARSESLGPESSLENFLSNPGSLFAAIYNQEAMLTGKYFIYNKEAQEFLDEIKIGIAEGTLQERGLNPKGFDHEYKLDFGTRLIRDLAAVPDFWSSGWRISKTLDQIANIVGPERAKEFGLFLRLRVDPKEGYGTREEVWGKIATHKPEDIVKLFRERVPSHDEFRKDDALRIAYEKYQELQGVFASNGIELTEEEEGKGQTYYDKFKFKFGPLISAIRQKGFDKDAPEQIDFTVLSQDQLRTIENFEVNGAKLGVTGRDQLISIFTAMKVFGLDSNVSGANGALIKSTRFEDIYTRTLSVDDALLNRLENFPEGSPMIALSKLLGSEAGGDALVRNFKDTKTAIDGFGGFLKFIREDDWDERIKNALLFAENASIYNGQSDKAKAVRYTVGTALGLAKEDLIWDALALSRSPFRSNISKMQKIYGQHGKVLSRDQLRQELDKYRSVLTGKDDEGKPKEAEKYYRALEKLLEANLKGRLKEKGLAVFFAFLLIAALEVVEVIKPRK